MRGTESAEVMTRLRLAWDFKRRLYALRVTKAGVPKAARFFSSVGYLANLHNCSRFAWLAERAALALVAFQKASLVDLLARLDK